MKLSEMKAVLSERGIHLTKSLGQNFLHDHNVLRKIAALAELQATDKVLEIGPGLGPLTTLLLDSGAEVFAIEKDKRLCEFLQKHFYKSQKFSLLNEDALEYLQAEERDWTGWKLVSNLPYSVASPILVEVALNSRPPERMVVTLQFEVAQRLVSKAGEENYGQLSLFIQAQYEPVEMFKVAASCFFPPPDVDSACIALQKRETALLEPWQLGNFSELVKQSFAERRKMMFKLLKEHWPEADLAKAFAEIGINPQARAESVSLEQFVALTNRLAK
jgi:16S rRNA (adenine1518-N6/adenine1519-N6)-dimethyltransferase